MKRRAARAGAAWNRIENDTAAMNNANLAFLAILGPPARLSVEQTAVKLNCQVHDIRTLVNAKLLKPLGNPPPSGVKYFATSEVVQHSSDPAWLARATNAIHRHWEHKNACRKSRATTSEEE